MKVNDYDVFYKSMIIGNVTAKDEHEALQIARAVYGNGVSVDIV